MVDIEAIKAETRKHLGADAKLDYITPEFVEKTMKNAKDTDEARQAKGEEIGVRYTVYGNSLYWYADLLYYYSGSNNGSSSDCCGDYQYSARSVDSTSFHHYCDNGKACYAIYK